MRVPVKHNLPKEEVRRRLRERMPELPAHMPGGTADVTTEWPSEDCMKMTVGAMGQQIGCRATVSDSNVHAIVDLPGFLGLFAGKIRDVIQQEAPKLLK